MFVFLVSVPECWCYLDKNEDVPFATQKEIFFSCFLPFLNLSSEKRHTHLEFHTHTQTHTKIETVR